MSLEARYVARRAEGEKIPFLRQEEDPRFTRLPRSMVEELRAVYDAPAGN